MSRVITIEICNDGKVFIADENSSGAAYDATTPEEIAEAVQSYLEDYPA